jgi:3-phenylpropionate/trans-cinnamate dioxygenase ferredoxin reductase subunit
MDRVVIVGASLAGAHAARTLREEGFTGSLTIVGEEPWMPYDRPPLSKQVLCEGWGHDEVTLSAHTSAPDAEWRLGTRATALELDRRAVILGGGERLLFDGLVIASGASPRNFDGSDMAGVHTLRTLDDALALNADLRSVRRRVVVVGAGFVGAEVASSCRRRGLPVTMLELLPAPLSSTLGPEIGETFAAMHVEEGVDLRVGVAVRRLVGNGRVEGVELSNGETVDADVVVVAIGVVPSIGWLEGSGIPLGDGVICDESCWVAAGIVAAGDVASWPNPHVHEAKRVEHWDNAIRQGEHAARRLIADSLGRPGKTYAPVPWVWSDQYDSKIQIVGFPALHDEVIVVAHHDEHRRLVAVYRRGRSVIGAVTVNRARAAMRLRSMIAARAVWSDAVALAHAG